LLCVSDLAAPQHWNYCNAVYSSMFISTMKPHSKAESKIQGDYPMLLSLIRMIQAFRDYQRNVSELSQLSDRELADIGLDRSDIPRVAAGTYNG
jgi:uncharacterized protein YjiS (DUF1127 family)